MRDGVACRGRCRSINAIDGHGRRKARMDEEEEAKIQFEHLDFFATKVGQDKTKAMAIQPLFELRIADFDSPLFEHCKAIRIAVFVAEQNYPLDEGKYIHSFSYPHAEDHSTEMDEFE